MWWVIVAVGTLWRFDPVTLNTLSLLYFNARAEYVLCLQGEVTDKRVTVDGFEFLPMHWASGASASAMSRAYCQQFPRTIGVIHTHLPHWVARNSDNRGGAEANCLLSRQDIRTWQRTQFELEWLQCGYLRYAVFRLEQLQGDTGNLEPWITLDFMFSAHQ